MSVITTGRATPPAKRHRATQFEPPAEATSADHIVGLVQERHPLAPPDLVQRCVDEATRHFAGVDIHLYLPILIERRASVALKAAVALEVPTAHPPQGGR